MVSVSAAGQSFYEVLFECHVQSFVQVDCYLSKTNFKLLGFFKEAEYSTWMEQLFKHEGICIWTDEEYVFMQDELEVLP